MRRPLGLFNALPVVLALIAGTAPRLVAPAQAADIIDQWASVKPPPPPELKSVTVNARTTALLMIDFLPSSCNPQTRKNCFDSLAAVKRLLDKARSNGLLVVYTAYGKNKLSDIIPEVAPKGDEPFVVAILDKYLHTDLDKILRDRGIDTVVLAGTATHGAVLATASESAERGFKVIVPVDGVSTNSLYAEQYAVWDLVNAPVISTKVTLARIDMLRF